jgi:hypothetical protein
LAYPALLGRLCLARAPRARLRLIRSRLFLCLDRRARRCDAGDGSHGGRLWATACRPRGTLFQFAIPCSVVMIDRSSVFGSFRTWGNFRFESVVRTKADVRWLLQIYGGHAPALIWIARAT